MKFENCGILKAPPYRISNEKHKLEKNSKYTAEETKKDSKCNGKLKKKKKKFISKMVCDKNSCK